MNKGEGQFYIDDHVAEAEDRELDFDDEIKQEESEIDQELQVRTFAKEFFQQVLNDEISTKNGFWLSQYVTEKLADCVGEREAFDKHQLPPAYREAVAFFLEELISFVQFIKDTRGAEEAQVFTSELEFGLFSISPSIINHVDLLTQFDFTARTTRVPEAQGFVGPGMVGELTYSLAFTYDGIVDDIVEHIGSLSIEEQMDYLHVCETVGMNAAAQGEWAMPALKKVFIVCKEIEQNSDKAFTAYLAGAVYERLLGEARDPSQGVARYRGARDSGRASHLTPDVVNEHTKFANSFRLTERRASGYHYVELSSDYVGIADHHGMLQECVKKNDFELKEEQENKPNLENVLDLIKGISSQYGKMDIKELFHYINAMEKYVLSYEMKDDSEYETFWNVSGGLSGSFVGGDDMSWRSFFYYHKHIVEGRKKLYAEEEKIYDEVSRNHSGDRMDAMQEVERRIQAKREKFLAEYDYALTKQGLLFAELVRNQKAVQNTILEHLQEVRAQLEKELPLVESKSLEFVIESKSVSMESGQEKQQKLLFQQMHHPMLREYMTNKLGIDIRTLSFRDQLQLLTFLSGQDDGTLSKLEAIGHKDNLDVPSFYESFLAYGSDRSIGKKLIAVAEVLDVEDANILFQAYRSFVDRCLEHAEGIGDDIFNGRSVNTTIILDAFLVRAKDILNEAYNRIVEQQELPGAVIKNILEALRQERPDQQIISGMFRKVSDALGHYEIGKLDLSSFEAQQGQVLASLEKEHKMGLFNRALVARGELAPIPEIHWRVDRGNEEYTRRFGFDLFELLEKIKDPNRKKVLLEFGPGSGKSKQERGDAGFDEYYLDMAMANKVYYPLNKFIEGVIDWESLEVDAGELSEEDRHLLSDMMYKVIMVKDGEIGQDDFSYAQERIQKLTKDPSAIRSLLLDVALNFGDVESVPDTISTRDAHGNVIYPYKINLTGEERQDVPHASDVHAEARSKVFLKAKKFLSEQMDKYLQTGSDVYDAIPAYTSGVMVGDFSRIEALKDEQVDVAVGVRSTVYKRGNEYIKFLEEMSHKLRQGGIYIDDSIRDNDGWTYRIAEMLEARQSFSDGVTLAVITGPGFRGEDEHKGEVPLGFVMGKHASYDEVLSSLMQEGYAMYDFDSFLEKFIFDGDQLNVDAIMKLDESGHLYETLSAWFFASEVRAAA